MEEPRSLPYYVGHDFAWDWGFNSTGDADRWLENLVVRGLVTCDKRHFYRITDAGRGCRSRFSTSIKIAHAATVFNIVAGLVESPLPGATSTKTGYDSS